MTDVAAFGVRMGIFRRTAGLSQQELAQRSGLSVRAVSNLERGRTRWPHPDTVHRLADALGLRDLARAEFVAAAGRRLAQPDGVPVSAVLDSRPSRRGEVVPRQLPAPVRQFAGREAELAALTSLLDHAEADRPAPVVISAIGGTAGIGKTALAVHWAHRVASRFPDGQLYVNLRGFDPLGKPLSAAAAIRGFLDALHVPAERIPAGLDAQAALYRSLLWGRRMLLVLDNGRDAAQVRPLLPASPGCLVVVTSRSQLSGLVAAEGACALTLDLLTEAEARELLARRLGAARLEAEPDATAELIGLCARLPLALAIAAARASSHSALRLSVLAQELKDARLRLDALETGDAAASVRSVFSWSLGHLPDQAKRMFGLLGLHPGPHITAAAAASLAGIPLPEAGRALGELAEGHLITEHAAGRFAMHDLLRAYAAEQALTADSDAGRRAAIHRVLDHYLQTAHAAALLLYPLGEPISLAPPQPGVQPEHLAAYQEAAAWFEAEHHVLLCAVSLAAETGSEACAWQLPWAMTSFLDWRGHWHEWVAVQRTALAAATRHGDQAGQAVARRMLATACARLADYDEARAHLTESLQLYRVLGDRAGEASAHRTLCWVAEHQDHYDDALSHAGQALGLFRAIADQAGQAGALNSVGWCHAMLGDYQQARSFCQQALALYHELGIRPGQAHTWDSLGYAEYQAGRLTDATACYTRALSIFRELGDRFYQADTLTHLGDTYHAAGDSGRAQGAWQQALDILDDLHHPDADQVKAKLERTDG
jgi:tetratricopeptide (TPR) repeat protein/transcriptional regulator with XRE-family HTH domain